MKYTAYEVVNQSVAAQNSELDEVVDGFISVEFEAVSDFEPVSVSMLVPGTV